MAEADRHSSSREMWSSQRNAHAMALELLRAAQRLALMDPCDRSAGDVIAVIAASCKQLAERWSEVNSRIAQPTRVGGRY
jgi:hypothetical protein